MNQQSASSRPQQPPMSVMTQLAAYYPQPVEPYMNTSNQPLYQPLYQVFQPYSINSPPPTLLGSIRNNHSKYQNNLHELEHAELQPGPQQAAPENRRHRRPRYARIQRRLNQRLGKLDNCISIKFEESVNPSDCNSSHCLGNGDNRNQMSPKKKPFNEPSDKNSQSQEKNELCGN
ncbi:Hypothetical protein CINCED_3A016602 [Cinara cedri]|uniref:Uncharacterized protein n=1 Tax=Cinara cedri TaxID=506608 RepID=A0A5E4NT22_9HEMI|nr:Hypothetical protein CINCED_3A016602 [Cinara cedri]